MTTFERMKKALVDCLGIREDAVTPSANFRDDLGLDSLEMVEVCLLAEEEFEIEISDDDLNRIVSLDMLVAHIDQAVAA